MRFASTGIFALCASILSAQASARPQDGTMGFRSQSSVQISVSIAPRFVIDLAAAHHEADVNSELKVSSNAPNLRVTLVTSSIEPVLGIADSNTTRRAAELVLVVPD